MYKKVYVEITNNCNLNCPFCIHNKRRKENIEIEKFKILLKKLKNHSKYLYLHVLGEPLLHPQINELIDIASEHFKVNITTNGYLIKRIKENRNIRQINISLQSFDELNGKDLNSYMHDLFETVDELKKYTFISYRIWIKNKYSKSIIECLNKKYDKNLNISDLHKTKLDENVFFDIRDEFIWPDLKNKKCNSNGKCYALKDHIAILVDGTIVPCCLDSNGTINLGNIYNDDLKDVIKSERYQKMYQGFLRNEKTEELCQKCNFIK